MTKIEVVEKEVRMEDVRSTVWVLKSVVYAISAVLLFLFMREMTGGVLPAANTVLESSASSVVDFVFDKLKI